MVLVWNNTLIRKSHALYCKTFAFSRENYGFIRESFALSRQGYGLIRESFPFICQSFAFVRDEFLPKKMGFRSEKTWIVAEYQILR